MTAANPPAPAPAPASSLKVSSLDDSGAGSLRSAILLANAQTAGNSSIGRHPATSGLSAITFTVRGTITLQSDLPAIATKTTIDGTSAPNFSGTTPVVEINANSHAGVVFAPGSAGSQLLGVAVDNATGPGVTLNASSITLDADYIGVNLAGAAFGNRGDGVYISPTSSNNLIGLNPKAASAWSRTSSRGTPATA